MNSRLRTFVQEMNLIEPEDISEETRVEKDLGMTGDDAIEFINEFSQNFKVDISEFDFPKYFGSEGIDLGEMFSRLLGKKRSNRAELTLLDLERAIDKGKLK